MLAKIQSAALVGLRCEWVDVEVDILPGLPAFVLVGLPDAAIQESRERVRSAIRNSGFLYPFTRVVVNLAPAHLKKMGPHFDLPIALGVLIAYGLLEATLLADTLIVGELALDGAVRSIHGILAITEFAHVQGFKRILLPYSNAAEANLIRGIEIIPIEHLKEAIPLLKGEMQRKIPKRSSNKKSPVSSVDMADIKGQEQVKRAMEIAAAGGHNLLLNGAPGAGKTMIAQVMRSILPSMKMEESLEVTKIYSVAGLLTKECSLITERPFRSIHHTASAVSMAGGGNPPRPGEISLAHRGVLFLDELAEFPKVVLEVLRQPMEDRRITVSRAQGSFTYPAEFTLVAAMNPCPCGYFNVPESSHPCTCPAFQVQRYHKKISGPLLDRIDMHIVVNPLPPKYFTNASHAESSEMIRKRVERARAKQWKRFKGTSIFTNSTMDNRTVQEHCSLTEEAQSLLNRALEMFQHSARGYYRILKVARTIADLADEEQIIASHIAEALHYRPKIL